MKLPIRCFEGNAKPYEPFWNWRVMDAAGESKPDPELEFYGFISEYSWAEDDITPKKFKNDLIKFGGGGPITIRMNSGGGEVFAASVIRSMLTEYPGKITVRIDGMCASAAVGVALAGDVIKMQDTAYLMIHDPAYNVFFASLNIETLSAWLDTLKTFKAGLVDTYGSRTGLSPERLSKMMTEETWMSASEAVKLGFADEVITGGKTADKNESVTNALKNYLHVPAALITSFAPQVQPLDREAQRLRDEVKILA
jgi:ATP-dependent Clp protease, protease subunit